MKREILFRGKSPKGHWVYGMPSYDLKYIFNDSNYDSHDQFEVIPETVGQFTGLTDKNGVKIFEGDLLRTPPNNKWEELNYSCFEVFFHGGNANSDYNIGYSISRMHNYGAVCGGYIPSFKPKTMSNMIVIGNIHDNQNLLQS
ncbi:MAG: YopX family protein [Candidatus Caldatribacteriota bacterium]